MRTPLILGIVLATCLASELSAQLLPLHSQALINDSRSHGVVGDNYLSLAESILLTNGQLSQQALSAAELNQLSGFGADIAWADIDARVVPVITFERDLPVIIDRAHGFRINGNFGLVVFEMGDTQGLVTTSDFCDFANLELRGGNHGIHITQSNSLFGSQIENVKFRSQTATGLRLTLLQANGNGRVLFEDCNFDGLRTALVIDDRGPGRTTTIDMNEVVITNCETSIDTILGDGGSFTLVATRVSISGTDIGFRIHRPGSAPSRSLVLDGRYFDIDANKAAFKIDGHATAQTRMLLQAFDLSSNTDTLSVTPLNSSLDLTLQDSRLSGGRVELLGSSTGKVELDNCSITNTSLHLGSTGAPITIKGSVLSKVTASTTGSQQVQIEDSRLDASALSATSQSPLQIARSHTANTSTGSNVTTSQPLPAAQLGTSDLSSTMPAVGSVLTLSVDLPAKLTGFWLFSTAQARPTRLNGLRIYLDLNRTAVLPVQVRAQQQVQLPIPHSTSLINREMYFQVAVSPDPGLTAPTLWLPPGRRVVLQ